MSEIFKRLTKGVSQTGTKVKNVVDVNRLKVKTAQQRRDLEKDYLQIGKIVYNSYRNNNENVIIDESVLELCRRIAAKLKEVNQLQARINDARNLKQCPCGEVLAKTIRFCPVCGNRFTDTI